MTATTSVLHEVVIAEWWLDTDRKIVISLNQYVGGDWCFVSVIWSRTDDGTLNPDRSFWVRVEHVERLAAAVEKARCGAVARDLIP